MYSMKAAQLSSLDGSNAISVNSDVAKPKIKEDEVLVEVAAASVNPFDWKLSEGFYGDGIKLTLPAVLGGDLAGVVTEIGSKVEGFTVGQAVYGAANAAGGHGAFAEYAPVSAKQLASMPKKLDFAEAAALPLVASAAYQAIVENMDLQKGQKVLIHGGAGGIGLTAIQLAKARGAYVATTVGADDIDYAKKLGANEVVDYKAEDFSKVIKDYDAVLDTVGGETNKKSYLVLKPGGVLVSMLEQSDEACVEERQLKYVQQNTVATDKRLQAINTFVEAGQVTARIDKNFSLDQTAEALEYLKTQHVRGKVIIQIKK